MEMGKPHKHAEAIKAWADDPEQGVQYFDCTDGKWLDIETPSWLPSLQYRIKPKTININGYEVPEPVREPLSTGCAYYVPSVDGTAERFIWAGDSIDYSILANGSIHLAREAAQLHSKAIFSFTRKP